MGLFNREQFSADFVLRLLLATVILTLATNVLSRSPLAFVFLPLEFYYIVLLLGFFTIYILDKIFVKRKINRLDFLMFFILLVPLSGAIATWAQFGQNPVRGVFSQVNYLMYLNGILLFYLLRNRIILLKHVEAAFIVLCWFNLLMALSMEAFLNPANYADTELVQYKDLKGGYFFRHYVFYIIFGGIYHLVYFLEQRKIRDLILFIPFFTFMVFVSVSRTMTVVFLLTLLFVILKKFSFKQLLVYGSYGIITLIIGVFALYFFSPETVNRLNEMYVGFFTAFTFQLSDDGSANSRLIQSAFIVNYMRTHIETIFFGTGNIALDFKGGAFGIFGIKIYYADTGIIGLWFKYGLLGVIILMSQYIFGFRLFSKIKLLHQDVLLQIFFFSLVCSFLRSFFTGMLTAVPGQAIIIIAIIYTFRFRDLEMQQSNASPSD